MANVYTNVEVSTMKRSQFHRRVPHHTSLPFGKWIPIGKPQWVLPHDTWRLDEKGIIRMLTPLLPIMTDISFDVCSFFVPYTIMWSKAKQFFGENDQVAWSLPNPEIDYPRLKIKDWCLALPEASVSHIDDIIADVNDFLLIIVKKADGSYYTHTNKMDRSVLDYFGLPVHFNQAVLANLYNLIKTSGTESSDYQGCYYYETPIFDLNALPFRADQLIYNNWFRNQNVTDPVKSFYYDDVDRTMGEYQFANGILMPRNAVRWKDLFTATLPAPQRGPSVTIGMSGAADIMLKNTGLTSMTAASHGEIYPVGNIAVGAVGKVTASGSNLGTGVNELYADLSTATATTINQIRYAFATQRYYEKLARGGALYRDYLKVMFGVTPADLSIQIPQLLGSKHFHINVNQVLSTAETLDSNGDVSNPVGSTGAVSATGFADHIFTNSMSQHGIILTYIAIRKEHSYCQGLDKEWSKTDIFDVYNPTFAHIGEVPVLTKEVYFDPSDGGSVKNDDVLGYNEAWYEYRYDRPITTGLLNPLNPEAGQLSAFTLCDVYESTPILDSNFIQEDPNGLDRSLVASASVTDQFVADLLCDYTVARVMPVHSTPGLLDHF